MSPNFATIPFPGRCDQPNNSILNELQQKSNQRDPLLNPSFRIDGAYGDQTIFNSQNSQGSVV